MRVRRIAVGFTCLASLLLASTAQGATLECGTVVTRDARLTQDLSCAGDGLVVGASGITIDLDGHTLEGVGGGAGIDNGGGRDRVTVRDGTIRGFDVGAVLDDAARNALVDLTVERARPSGIGMTLDGSDRNRIERVSILGGDPALRLTDSDSNDILDSDFKGGIAIRQGNDIELRDGSDRNRIAGNYMDGEGDGFSIFDSDANVVEGNETDSYGGNHVSGERNRLEGNRLTAELHVAGDRNTVRDNELLGGSSTGFRLEGDRNRVVGNTVAGGGNSLGITVAAGRGNLVEGNLVQPGVEDLISVLRGAERTRVIANTANGGADDGIDVEGRRTIVGSNVTNSNGDLGIEAVQGTIDAGGNRASGNGDPRQCVGVTCT